MERIELCYASNQAVQILGYGIHIAGKHNPELKGELSQAVDLVKECWEFNL